MTLIQKALTFASNLHTGQERKYTGLPYITHPRSVAALILTHASQRFCTEVVIAAALLHDVVEDCDVTLETLTQLFGPEVADLVGWVTDVSQPSDGNRKVRKAKDRDHLAIAPAAAQTIKLADLIDNTSTIVQYDPDFAAVYMREKAELLGVMLDGDTKLYEMADKLVTDYLTKETVQ